MYISVTLIKILKAFGTVLIKGCVFEKVMAIKKNCNCGETDITATLRNFYS